MDTTRGTATFERRAELDSNSKGKGEGITKFFSSELDMSVPGIMYEFRAHQVRTGPVKLVPYSNHADQPGFISLFGFPDPVVKAIESSGSTSNLSGAKLFCHLLYLDFDDNDRAADEAEAWLVKNEYLYNRYDTGNRGWHFHIPIKPIYQIGVHLRCREFVRKTFKGADLGIYKTSGIIRIRGTIHSKTTRRKEVFSGTSYGYLLELPEYEPPLRLVNHKVPTEELLLRLEAFTMQTVSTGGRSNYVYAMSRLCRDCGLDLDECIEKMLEWNATNCSPPLTKENVIKQCRGAYV